MGKGSLTERWRKLKKDQILIGILAGALLLVIALPGERKTAQTASEQVLQEERNTSGYAYTDSTGDAAYGLEMELQDLLEQVQGVGRVQVMITVRSSGKRTVEKDQSVSEESGGEGEGQSKRTEETTIQGNEIPFVTEETAPQVQGVLIAAQGGDNPAVAESISQAAMVLFGVEAHRIKVMKLN